MSTTRLPAISEEEEEEEADPVTEQFVTTEEEDLLDYPEEDFPEDEEEGNEEPGLAGVYDEEEGEDGLGNYPEYKDNRSERSGRSSQGRKSGGSQGRESGASQGRRSQGSQSGKSPHASFEYGEEEGEGEGEWVEGQGQSSEETKGSMEGEEEGEDADLIEFLKAPASLGNFMEEWDAEEAASAKSSKSSINIMEMPDMTRGEAAILAEYVVGLVEEDLAAYVEKTGTTFPPPWTKTQLKRMRRGLNDDDSASSFDSDLSEVLPGEPSRIRMTYEKGVSAYCDMSLINMAHEHTVDKEIQVNLHRTKKKTPVMRFSRYCQTLEMTFIPMETSLLIFKQMYPQMDDFIAKDPPSRQASQEFAISIAEQADPNIDNKRKGPQIISLSNKKQLLQPLMDDYHKDEKFWTGSRFVGEYKNRQVFKGRYDHPTAVKMESEFVNGHFESLHHYGLVSYPRGDTFEGSWKKGRYKTGQITFCDGLKFASKNWKYCEPPDRRFKIERYFGLKPAGMTLFSDQYPPPHIPPGMYEVGDGFYNPKTGDVRGYDGFLLRQATPSERKWIEKNCRKVHESIDHIAPNFLMERIPGSYAETQMRLPLPKYLYH